MGGAGGEGDVSYDVDGSGAAAVGDGGDLFTTGDGD